jgi:hypothetical protein
MLSVITKQWPYFFRTSQYKDICASKLNPLKLSITVKIEIKRGESEKLNKIGN